MNPLEDLKKTYGKASIISASIIATLLIYFFCVELIRSQFKPFHGLLAFSEIQLLRYLFYGISVLEVLAIGLLRPALLKESPAEDPKMFLAKLSRVSIITLAFCEVPANLGFILFLIGGLYKDFLILLFLSLLTEVFYFPRFRDWEEKLRKRFLLSRFQGGTK